MPTIEAHPAPDKATRFTQNIQTKQSPFTAPDRQIATAEPVAPVLEATEKKEELLSPKFAALARKEKAFRDREAKLKAREDALAQQGTTPQWDQKSIAEKMRSAPWETLSEWGLSPDEITQIMLNQPKPEAVAIQRMEAKLTDFEKKFSEPLTKFEEQQSHATEQAMKQIRHDAKLLIDSDPAYEMIKTKNASEAVAELVKQHFDETGLLLSVEEAAKEVETYLADQVYEEIKQAQQIKKIQERLNPPVQAQQPPLVKQPLKTLTNAVSTASTKPILSEKERVQRAILAFKGQLK